MKKHEEKGLFSGNQHFNNTPLDRETKSPCGLVADLN